MLLGKGDRVVLTDFGIAQVEGDEQRLTETGALVGSPEFIAPERGLGQQPGPASGLWSLGVVPYAGEVRGAIGGPVAVVLVLVLIAVDPFGGGLPEDWVSRPEAETVAADIGVPREYKRSASDSDDTSVRFEDPSGVFFVYVERVDRKEKTSFLDEKSLAPAASAWKRYYERGGSDESEIEEAKVTTTAVEHQGRRDSFETVVDHYRYGEADDEDALRRRYHELVVPGEDQVYWRLRVGMPGAGKALEDGEELFRTITDNFTVQL
ncbi:hypothetical protein ACIQY8_01230 [Streptomyces albidoflavus]